MNKSKLFLMGKGCIAVSSLMASVLFFASQAHALEITAVGTFQVSSLTTNYGGGNDAIVSSGITFTNNGFSSSTSFGGGLLLSQSLLLMFSIEAGVLYQPRSVSQNVKFSGSGVNDSYTVDFTSYYWQIPVLARYHFLELFSAGFGAYYAHAIGNVKYTASSTNATVEAALPKNTLYAGYEDNGVSRDDYGLLFAAGAEIPIPVTSFSVYGDLRYALGLKDIHAGKLTSVNSNNSIDDNKWRQFQILLGLKYSL